MSTKHPPQAPHAQQNAGYGLNTVPHHSNAGIGTFDASVPNPEDRGRERLLKAQLPTVPSLAMPKGGGAIQGMGEKFTVNPSNGTCSLAVPIRTSNGRSGIQPNMSLVYDSGSGNSPFGLGWSLKGVDAVTRKTSKGVPRYATEQAEDSDVFMFAGMEDLVPVYAKDEWGKTLQDGFGRHEIDRQHIDGHIVQRYMLRIMEDHSRIEKWTKLDDMTDVHWRVITTDNVVKMYGSSEGTRIYDKTQKGTPRIYSWLIAEAWDPQGNAMIYTYKSEDSANILSNAANELNRTHDERAALQYPKSIHCGNIVPNRNLETWAPFSAFDLNMSDWMFSIVFDYGEHHATNPTPHDGDAWHCRQDPFSTYRPGFELRTYRLCRRVLVFHHFEELPRPDCLVSSTDFLFDENPSGTYLVSIEQAGYVAGAGSSPLRKSLPPIRFLYTKFPDDAELDLCTVEEVDKESIENLPVGTDGSSYQWLDLDGEGIAGILSTQDEAWYYKRNLTLFETSPDIERAHQSPKLRLGPLEAIGYAPSLFYSPAAMSFGDVNGNGKLDVISHSQTSWGYFERDSGTASGWSEFCTFPQYPQGTPKGRSLQFIDLTGDGLSDILILEDQVFLWHEFKAVDGYANSERVTQANREELGPGCFHADIEQSLHLADMSGDGLNDLVRIRNGACCYWPNLGYGRFGKQVQLDNAPYFDLDDQFSTTRVRIADVDGTGTSDLIYYRDGVVDIYLNQAGNSLSHAKTVSFPQYDQHATLDIVDLLGTGTMCLVWSSSLPSSIGTPMRYVDLCRGEKPQLLSTIINSIGSETHITYAPSTKFYLEDRISGNEWITRLPFPVHCISSMEVIDRITGNRFKSDYRYRHGFYDCVEREFRGFARVDQTDSTIFFAADSTPITNSSAEWNVAPTRTTTWFHTGAYQDRRSLDQALTEEYFTPSWLGEIAAADGKLSPLKESPLPVQCNEGNQQHEAYRALKGKIIRTETYGMDGTANQHIPYTVHQTNFSIVAVQPEQNRFLHGVYQVHPRESMAIYYDRAIDNPRISHSMTLEVDYFGNPMKELTIAYGRSSAQVELDPRLQGVQRSNSILFLDTRYTAALLGHDFRTPLPYDVRQWELTGLSTRSSSKRFTFDDLVHNSFKAILDLPELSFEQEAQPGMPARRLLRREHILYRRNDLTGHLPAGQVESLGLPGVLFEMAFTPALLTKVYQTGTEADAVHLIPDPAVTMGSTTEGGAGYVDVEGDGCWWKSSGEIAYIANPGDSIKELAEARRTFFMPKYFRDPFGNASTVVYDNYHMFPVGTEDALGNINSSLLDYRVLQPSSMTDLNGNITSAKYDALGMLVGSAIMGKMSDNVGDTLEGFEPDLDQATIHRFFQGPSADLCGEILGTATTRIVYDLWRWQNVKAPIYSAIISREHHVNSPESPGGDHFPVVINYSDGFGRIIQSKSPTKTGPLAEGGAITNDRWIGTGWTVFNNKGDPVKKFEPFFDSSHGFQKNMTVGVSSTVFYDPVGRVTAILRPDHALSKAIYTPWSEVLYDTNDMVLLSDPRLDADIGYLFEALPESEFLPSWYDQRARGQLGPEEHKAAVKASAHADTPRTSYLDPMGRAIHVVSDNGVENIAASIDLDIQGNAIGNRDPLDRVTLTAQYDMCSRRIHTSSLDAGEAWILHDALDKMLLKWNSRNYRFRTVSDPLRRPVQYLVQEGESPEIVYQETIHGEQATNAAQHNLRGSIWKVRDQAGLLVQEAFDFKGNLLASSQYLHKEYKAVLNLSMDAHLGPEVFTTSSTYDALSRPVQSTAPDATITHRVYDRTGSVAQVYINVKGEQDPSLDPRMWTPIVLGFDYNAKGQIISTKLGNNTTIFRRYDPLLDRLSRIRTVGDSGDILQDLKYVYDAVGNITSTRDDAQQTLFFRNAIVEPSCEYTYDPAYRLVQATGRENVGQTGGRPSAPGAVDDTHIGSTLPDGNSMARFVETYRYDQAGNIRSMKHDTSDSQTTGWTRTYSYNEFGGLDPGIFGNRLTATTIGSVSETYKYEGTAGLTGNMTSMSSLPVMQWDYADQLHASSRQNVNTGIPEMTYYIYNHQGTRIRKITESHAGEGSPLGPVRMKERIYLGDYEIFRQYAPNGNDIALERTTFHANTEALARIERRTRGTDSRVASQTRFQLSNLLGSVCLELDDEGELLSYEEYFPYGSTSYQATPSQTHVQKRYRYTNKELDSENGLYYFGARYYAAWLGRWTSCDPKAGPKNCYDFVSNNPIHLVDPDGNAPNKKGGATFENRSGTYIHQILTWVLQDRLARMGVHSVANVETHIGGSKNDPHNLKGTNQRGKIDIAPLMPTLAGTYEAHTYEFGPAVKSLKEAYDKSSETQLYSKYYPKGINEYGQNVVDAQVGTMLESLEKLNPLLIEDPIKFSNAFVDIELKMKLPADTQRGVKVAGLVTYTLTWKRKTKQGNEKEQVIEALKGLRDQVKNQGVSKVHHGPPPLIVPGRPGVNQTPQQPQQPQTGSPQEKKPEIRLDGEAANDNAKEEEAERQKAARETAEDLGKAGAGTIILYIILRVIFKGRMPPLPRSVPMPGAVPLAAAGPGGMRPVTA